MAYTATYGSGEFDDIIIDVLGGITAGIASQAWVLGSLAVILAILMLASKLLKGTFNFMRVIR